MSDAPADEVELVADAVDHAAETVKAVVRETRRIEARRRLDLDVRGVLALIAVLGLFGIVFVQLAQGRTVTIPPEVAATVGAVGGFYFGSKPTGNGRH